MSIVNVLGNFFGIKDFESADPNEYDVIISTVRLPFSYVPGTVIDFEIPRKSILVLMNMAHE
ncbi:hypothetical protein NLX69_00465 [Rossellomorea sp. BNER]|nr:hypothetical protein [Rossellomorea sp. BNER]